MKVRSRHCSVGTRGRLPSPPPSRVPRRSRRAIASSCSEGWHGVAHGATLPGLEGLQRADAVAREGARLDPGADRRLAQRIVPEGPVGQRFDGGEVAGAAAVVHLADEPGLDGGPEPGALLVTPVIERGRIGDLELFEEAVEFERRNELGGEHITPRQPVEVALEFDGGPDGLVVSGEALRIHPVPEAPDGGAHRVARLVDP